MRSIFKTIEDPDNKYWNWIQISVLLGYFFYFFAQNFALFSGWETLYLRSIDDWALQSSIRRLQNELISGQWRHVFSFFDCAYGNAFWVLNSLLLLPFRFIGDGHSAVIVGREITLMFIFGCIYLMGQIVDQLYPDARSLKYPVLISIALMPMIAINAMKFHVNSESTFFGILSFYLLVKEPILTRKNLIYSSIFGGMAVGFKLTGIFIVPLLGLTFLSKIGNQNKKQKIKETITFICIFIVTAMFCTCPELLFFPFFKNELIQNYHTFLAYKNMANGQSAGILQILEGALSLYVSTLGLNLISILFLVLVFYDLKQRRFISLYLLITLLAAVIVVTATTYKGSIYIATYLINVGFFIPFGLIGISKLPISAPFKPILGWGIIIAGLIYGHQLRKDTLLEYDYFAKAKNENIKQCLQVREEIRPLVEPILTPMRILQDPLTIFPATSFTEGVQIDYLWGNLKSKVQPYDYIFLNQADYYGRQSLGPVGGANVEAGLRSVLHQKGLFEGHSYDLIYDAHRFSLFKLKR